MLGTTTFRVEVLRFSEDGFLLHLYEGEELFVGYEDFPWFRNANMEEVMNVSRLNSNHLYWPELDIDIEVESIRHPELYPMLSRR